MFTIILLMLCGGYIAAVVAAYTSTAARNGFAAVWQLMALPFQQSGAAANRSRRRRYLEDKLADELTNGTASDDDVLTAARKTMEIHVVHRWTKDGLGHCLDVHWALATALNVREMHEAAAHPRAMAARHHNLEVLEFLRDTIAGYPFPTPELVQLEVTIPRLAATCSSCPYFFLDRASAPRVCPSALAVGYGRKTDGPSVMNGELVDEPG